MSSEAKFTQGPWFYDNYILVDGSVRVVHGNITITYHGEANDHDIANAHLIAAAPEMYAEIERDVLEVEARLKFADKRTLAVNPDVENLKRKKALLAKARGEL
ncbi:hypothetical protein VPH234P10_0020 [Vibrio phage 234P10]|nr:hypothetical protein SIPHO062v1_p0019 [Vibrio phage PS17B.1]